MISRQELGDLLATTESSEHINWNKERIISCVEDLQSQVAVKGLKALDLGHDTHVGLLLAAAGLDIIGNVAPSAPIDAEAPLEQWSHVKLPDGRVFDWKLDEFDFEGRFPYADQSFDLVTALEVIEHVVGSPRAFIQEVKRVLKPGGHFYIGTPNINCWAKILRQFRHSDIYDSKPYSQNFGPRHFMCHVYEYSPWEIKELFKSEGFEIISLHTWDPYPSDPRGLRSIILKGLISVGLLVTGYLKEAALMYKDRGHQMSLLVRAPG
jgi:SAM-dependent methyltransferase